LSLPPWQEVAKVKVQRWHPGVVDELIEESEHYVTGKIRDNKHSVEERLLSEATEELEKKCRLQLTATKQKSLPFLLKENEGEQEADMRPEGPQDDVVSVEGLPTDVPQQRTRRVRQKMRSVPIVGGGLFEDSTYGTQKTGTEVEASMKEAARKRLKELARQAEPVAGDVESQAAAASTTASAPRPTLRKMLSVPGHEPATSEEDTKAAFERFRRLHKSMAGRDQFFAPNSGPAGIQAELLVQGETFRIRIPQDTLEELRKGYSGEVIDNRGLFMSGITMAQEDAPVVNMLHGYVRSGQPKIN
jgi:hypothetical protein